MRHLPKVVALKPLIKQKCPFQVILYSAHVAFIISKYACSSEFHRFKGKAIFHAVQPAFYVYNISNHVRICQSMDLNGYNYFPDNLAILEKAPSSLQMGQNLFMLPVGSGNSLPYFLNIAFIDVKSLGCFFSSRNKSSEMEISSIKYCLSFNVPP